MGRGPVLSLSRRCNPGEKARQIRYDFSMGLGLPEMLFIFFLALMIFGPRKLPEIGRQIGKFMAEFKRYSNEFKHQVEVEVRQLELEEALKKADMAEPPPVPPAGTIANATAAPASAPAPNPPVEAKTPDA